MCVSAIAVTAWAAAMDEMCLREKTFLPVVFMSTVCRLAKTEEGPFANKQDKQEKPSAPATHSQALAVQSVPAGTCFAYKYVLLVLYAVFKKRDAKAEKGPSYAPSSSGKSCTTSAAREPFPLF
jgi:hypothetical protein